MKKQLSTVTGACLGLCAGFALCYICLVLPHREGKATASAQPQMHRQERNTITIARDGSLYLGGERLDVSQLSSRLKELDGQQPVSIRADRKTDYKRVVEVMDACKVAAISRISATVVHRKGSDLWILPSNNFVQATAVFAFLFILSQVPAAPDENR